jgi:hypothetical protein
MSSRLLGTSCIALLLSCVFACKGQEPTTPVDGEDPAKLDFKLADAVAGLEGSGALTAKLETNHGVLVVKLFEAEVPKTVANFVGLARGLRPWRDPKTGDWVKRPFYDGLTFHRVIPDFMIQGGDPLGVGNGGPGTSSATSSSRACATTSPAASPWPTPARWTRAPARRAPTARSSS